MGDRPDRAGYVVDDLPVAPLIQIWLPIDRPDGWKNVELLKYIHSKMATHAIVIRTGVAVSLTRQLSNWEVICWLEHFGAIDDDSYPYLIESPS